MLKSQGPALCMSPGFASLIIAQKAVSTQGHFQAFDQFNYEYAEGFIFFMLTFALFLSCSLVAGELARHECSLVEFSRLLAPGGPRFRARTNAYLSALDARGVRRPSRSSRGQATLPSRQCEHTDYAWHFGLFPSSPKAPQIGRTTPETRSSLYRAKLLALVCLCDAR